MEAIINAIVKLKSNYKNNVHECRRNNFLSEDKVIQVDLIIKHIL